MTATRSSTTRLSTSEILQGANTTTSTSTPKFTNRMEEDFVASLRAATKDCSDRGLYFASKWASELLLSIPADKRKRRKTNADQSGMASISMSTAGGPTDAVAEMDLEEDEMDILNAGRSYAEAKEFTRASHLLEKCKSAKGKFMHFYFKFLLKGVREEGLA